MAAPFAHDEPGTQNRFEIWVRGVCVHASDHEAFCTVFVDGEEIFNLNAQMEYEDPADMKYGERPAPIGFTAKATAKSLDGKEKTELGERIWRLRRDVDVTDEVKRGRPLK